MHAGQYLDALAKADAHVVSLVAVARAGFFVFVATVFVSPPAVGVGRDAGDRECGEDDQARDAFHVRLSLG